MKIQVNRNALDFILFLLNKDENGKFTGMDISIFLFGMIVR